MKNVIPFVALTLLACSFSSAFGQSGGKKIQAGLFADEIAAGTMPDQKALALRKHMQAGVTYKKDNPSPLSCDTLSTTWIGGNGQSGNMFDITAINAVTISYFDCHVTGAGYIKIYYLNGTFVGNETNPMAWTFIDSIHVTSAGSNIPTPVLIPVNVPIAAAQTVGFYITGNNSGAGLAYNNGTAIGNIISSNADIQIKEGTGNPYPFGPPFSPRNWNGMVHYCDSGSTPPPNANFKGDTLIICAGDSVAFTDLSGFAPTSWAWSFAGGSPASSTLQNPVVTYTASGNYTVSLTATNASGNHTLTKNNYVMVLSNIGAPPVTEDFEGALFPPANFYLIDGGGNGFNWAHDSTASGFGFGTASISFNNYIMDAQGAKDQFRTQKVNLTTMTVPTLYFDVAYAPFNKSFWSDTLEIYASTDCGKTFTSLYSKGGMTLCTAGDSSAAEFIPTPSQWRTDSIDLASLTGQADVIFVFENRGWFGNKLYIDHINLGKNPSPYPNFTAQPLVICAGDTVQFTNQSSNATSYSWAFAGGNPATSTQVSPAVAYAAPGSYAVSLTATNATGTNSVTITNYVTVIGNMGSAPILEDFEAATFPPAAFFIEDDGNDLSVWSQNLTASGYGIGANSISYDNYTIDATGTYDAFVSKPMDFSASGANPYLLFDVAYAPYDALLQDSLNIYASSDCGKTYTLLYSKGGTVLATAPANTNPFVPVATEWRTDTVDLTAFAGIADVSVKFENRPGFGNFLFVDNINIVNGTGINELAAPVDLKLFPNPMGDMTNLSIRSEVTGLQVVVSDMTGRPIHVIGDVSANGSVRIQRNGMSSGVYMVEVRHNRAVIRTIKLVVQ